MMKHIVEIPQAKPQRQRYQIRVNEIDGLFADKVFKADIEAFSEVEAITAAREWYASSLGTTEDNINVEITK